MCAIQYEQPVTRFRGEEKEGRKAHANVGKSNVIKPPTKSPSMHGGRWTARIESKRPLKNQMVSGTVDWGIG